MNILKMMGLMRVSEHEEVTRLKTDALDTIAQSYCGEVKAATDWEAKFNCAATDLAAQSVKAADLAVEVERLRVELVARKRLAELQGEVVAGLRSDIKTLTPDALAWREKKRKDADYEANRRVRKK